MSHLSQVQSLQEETNPAWEGREDDGVNLTRSTRRKSANNCVPEALDTASRSLSPRSKDRAKKLRLRERIRSCHRDVLTKSESEASHANSEERVPHSPLHYFQKDVPITSADNSPKTFKKTHNKDANFLKQDMQSSLRSDEKKSADGYIEGPKQDENDEISTTSTSGSNSSSSSSLQRSNPKFDVSLITSARDSDQELEQCSRQIRMELRQAEMLELAAEAERAAAAGRKSFSGRASTFGDDSELDLPVITSQKKSKPSVMRQSTIDFGTPLKRRSQAEKYKISVVALRDVTEVVPCFKDFHNHLRTHLARRHVNDDMLLFEEVNHPSARTESFHSGNEHNMIDLLSSFNFGNWASSNQSLPEANSDANGSDKPSTIEEKPSESSTTSSAVGDLLAEHMPLRASRNLHVPKIEVPPGLKLSKKESVTLQGKGPITAKQASAGKAVSKLDKNQAPATPGWTATSTGSANVQQKRGGSEKLPFQDGSPNSPIIIDDIFDQGTPERKTAKSYRNQGQLPGLPLTPTDNFQDIFESQFATPREATSQATIGAYLETPNDYDFRDILGCDFDTPVRLRDIRDEHLFNDTKMMAKLPRAPLMKKPTDSSNAQSESKANTQATKFELASHLRDRALGGQRLSDRFDEMAEPHTDTALVDSSLDATSDLSEQNGKLESIDSENQDLNLPRNISGYYRKEREVQRCAPASEEIHDEALADDAGQIIQCASMPVLEGPQPSSIQVPLRIRKGFSYDFQSQSGGCSGYDGGALCKARWPSKTNTSCDEKIDTITCLNRGRLCKPVDDFLPDNCNRGKVVESCNGNNNSRDGYSSTGTYPNLHENSVIDMNGIYPSPKLLESVADDTKQANQSKGTNDFRCECLISPASSLESEDDDGLKFSVSRRHAIQNYSAWSLMESSKDGSHQPLQAAVAMFSKISPTGRSSRLRLNLASTKENDAFMTNYLYCSKTQEAFDSRPEPNCAAPPCQDTQMPCGDIAVDTCVGNILESTLKFLPKKSAEGKKLLNLNRNEGDEVTKKHLSWYDMANERFDRLLDRLMGNEHHAGDQWQTFQAPTLREKKAPSPPEETPSGHEEIYDDDLGGVVLIQNSNSLDTSRTSTGHSGHPTFTEKPRLQRHFHLQDNVSEAALNDRRLHHNLSDSNCLDDKRDFDSDSSYLLQNRHSM